MINDKVDPFINQYRDALERQRDLGNQNLDNTRRNDYATIMGNANTAGMMYSNFPERSKIQYDTQTYMPNQTKIQNTYQTGLDKLRSNTVSLSNQLKNINDAIADLNKTGSSGGSNGSNGNNANSISTINFGNGYSIQGQKGGEAAYYKDGKKISAGEFLQNAPSNWDNWNKIWNSGIKTNGVGSDTVNAFYNSSWINPKGDQYGYLFGN